MKPFCLAILCAISLLACNNAKPTEKQDGVPNIENAPKFKFEEESTDFGQMKEGDIIEHRFKFENVGKSELIITTVQAQCGCTIPNWPQKPIGPGEEGVINVKFDSKGKAGVQKKWITILSNSFNGQDYLSFTADVRKR